LMPNMLNFLFFFMKSWFDTHTHRKWTFERLHEFNFALKNHFFTLEKNSENIFQILHMDKTGISGERKGTWEGGETFFI
jgi:hypothetical protein